MRTSARYKNLSATGHVGKSGAPTFYFGTSLISPKLIEVESWNLVRSQAFAGTPGTYKICPLGDVSGDQHTTSHHETTVSWSGGVMWFSFDIVLWCYVVSSHHQTTSHNEIMSHHETTWDHHHITAPRHITRWPCRGLLVSCSLVMWWWCDVIWWCDVVSLCDGDLTLSELHRAVVCWSKEDTFIPFYTVFELSVKFPFDHFYN